MTEGQKKNSEINQQDSINSLPPATVSSKQSSPDLDILTKLAPEEGIALSPNTQKQVKKLLVEPVEITEKQPSFDPFTQVVQDIHNFSEIHAFETVKSTEPETSQQNTEITQQALVAVASSPAEILIAEVLKHEPITPIPASIPVQMPAKKEEQLTETTAPDSASQITQESEQDEAISPPVSLDQKKDELIQPSVTTQDTIHQNSQTETLIDSSTTLSPEVAVSESASKNIGQKQPQSLETDTKTAPVEIAQKKQHIVLRFFKNPSVLMVLSTLLFSSMILFVKLASDYYTSFEIICFRGVVGILCILVYQLIAHGIKGIQLLKTAHIGMQAWRAFIGTMSMVFWFYGVSYLTLALSTTLNYMSSIWIAIFVISTAFITGKARPNFKLIVSVLLGFAGIVVILRPSGTDINMFAAAIVIIGSFFGALAYLQVAALGRIGEPAYRTVFYFCLFSTLFGLVAIFATQGGFSPFSLIGFAWLVPIGILAMIAQLCLTMAYTGGNPLVNASLQYSGLIFVVLFDWILGYGLPDAIAWIGMSLVVIAGLSATFFQAKKSTLSKDTQRQVQTPAK